MTYGWWDVGGTYVELCDECGFDSRLCADEGRGLAAAYADLAELAEHPHAGRSPRAGTWSAAEYAAHCVDVTRELMRMVVMALGRPALPVLTDLAAASGAVAEVVPELSAPDRAAPVAGEFPQVVSVEWVVRHLLHDVTHHVLDVRRGYAALAMAELPEVFSYRR